MQTTLILKKLTKSLIFIIGGLLILVFLFSTLLVLYLKSYGISSIAKSALQSETLVVEDMNISLPKISEEKLIFENFNSSITYSLISKSGKVVPLKFNFVSPISIISSSNYLFDIDIELPEFSIEHKDNVYLGSVKGKYTFASQSVDLNLEFPSFPATSLCSLLIENIPELSCKSGAVSLMAKINLRDSLIEILEANIGSTSLSGQYKESIFHDLNISFFAKGTSKEFEIENGHFKAKELELPLKVMDVSFSFKGQIDKDIKSVKLSSVKANILGGNLNIKSMPWDSKIQETSFDANLSELDLSKVAELYQDENLNQNLKLNGTLDVFAKIILTNSFQVEINEGRFSSPPNKNGYIKIGNSSQGLDATQNQTLANLQNILKDFNYSDLSGTLTLERDGTLKLATHIFGSSPLFQNSRAIDLNVNLEENVYSLIKSLKIKSDLDQQIDKALKK